MIHKANELILQYHSEQTYGAYPYVYHLYNVAAQVAQYGKTYEIVALLHDILEDTEIQKDLLLHEFGDNIVTAIELCSYDMTISNKGERTLEFYERWKGVNKGHYYEVDTVIACANAVKVADRLQNIRHCIWWNRKKKLEYYLDEMTYFREALYIPGNATRMWLELDLIMMNS